MDAHTNLKNWVSEIKEKLDSFQFPSIPCSAISDESGSIAVFVDGELYTKYHGKIYRVTK